MSRRKTNSAFSPHDVLAALRSSIRILSVGMAAVVVVYLASGITVVSPNEVGLILRFGKLERNIHRPGLLYALPPPLDEVIKVPVKTVQEVPLDLLAEQNADASQTGLNPIYQPYTLTGDVNIIRASFVVRFQVSDPADYVLNTTDRTALRDAILYRAACRVLASMGVEDALTVGKSYIGVEASRIAQEQLDHLGMGIHLLAFETRDINPPASVSAAFQAVVSAKVQAKTLLEQANAYQAATIPNSKAAAYRIQQTAEAYARQQVVKAQGEATSFSALLEEYNANPALVRTRLQSEMLGMVMPTVKWSTLMPAGTGPTRIFLAPQPVKPLAPVKSGDDSLPQFGNNPAAN